MTQPLWKQSRGASQPLVLLHGWGMNAAVWQPLLQQLESTYSVTRIELPGHGQSPYDESKQSLTDWASAVLDVAPADAIWLGWSLGGLVALQAALLPGSHIKALLLLSATPCFVQRADWSCAMPQATLQQFADNLVEDSAVTLQRFLALQTKGMADALGMLKSLRSDFAERPPATPAALRNGLQLLRDSDLRGQLSNIEMPVSWIFGERDMLVPACAAQQIERLMPDASVTSLQQAAHVPFLSHWSQCLAALQQLEAQAYA